MMRFLHAFNHGDGTMHFVATGGRRGHGTTACGVRFNGWTTSPRALKNYARTAKSCKPCVTAASIGKAVPPPEHPEPTLSGKALMALDTLADEQTHTADECGGSVMFLCRVGLAFRRGHRGDVRYGITQRGLARHKREMASAGVVAD